MGRVATIICGWPGLQALWRRGRVIDLLPAVGFAVLLNGAIIATFVCPESLPAGIHRPLWLIVVAVWCVSARRSWVGLQQPITRKPDPVDEGLFLRAQAEYLKGHWFEAEAILHELLRRDPDDAESRLMLASLLRRMQRDSDAERHLQRLAQNLGASKWHWEVERERALIERNRGHDHDQDESQDADVLPFANEGGAEGSEDEPTSRAA